MAGDMLSHEALEIIAERFKLMSCPTRLGILQELCAGELAVGELVERTGQKQANLSKHLGLLSRAGLVRRRAEGIHVYYALAHESLPRICDLMKEIVLATERELREIFPANT